jgi:hypothetical protein
VNGSKKTPYGYKGKKCKRKVMSRVTGERLEKLV